MAPAFEDLLGWMGKELTRTRFTGESQIWAAFFYLVAIGKETSRWVMGSEEEGTKEGFLG